MLNQCLNLSSEHANELPVSGVCASLMRTNAWSPRHVRVEFGALPSQTAVEDKATGLKFNLAEPPRRPEYGERRLLVRTGQRLVVLLAARQARACACIEGFFSCCLLAATSSRTFVYDFFMLSIRKAPTAS